VSGGRLGDVFEGLWMRGCVRGDVVEGVWECGRSAVVGGLWLRGCDLRLCVRDHDCGWVTVAVSAVGVSVPHTLNHIPSNTSPHPQPLEHIP